MRYDFFQKGGDIHGEETKGSEEGDESPHRQEEESCQEENKEEDREEEKEESRKEKKEMSEFVGKDGPSDFVVAALLPTHATAAGRVDNE